MNLLADMRPGSLDFSLMQSTDATGSRLTLDIETGQGGSTPVSHEVLAHARVEAPRPAQLEAKLGQALWDLVWPLVQARNPEVTCRDLAKRAGFSHTAIWHAATGRRVPTLRLTLGVASAAGLGVRLDKVGTTASMWVWACP